MSALDIEREILGLDYISEVMVVGVDDEEFGQRLAAAIVLKAEVSEYLKRSCLEILTYIQGPKSLTLETLRQDLKDSLAGYKMPTVLRIVNELKKNATGKVIKKALVKELFPAEGHPDVQRWKSGKTKGKL